MLLKVAQYDLIWSCTQTQNIVTDWQAAALYETRYVCLFVDLSMNRGWSTTHGAASPCVGRIARRNYPTHMEIL